MSNLFSKNKRDGNESDLLDIFTAAGGFWEQTRDGHDGVLHLRHKSFIVEIKVGNAPLTPAEVKFKNKLERTGVRYWILRTEQDALNLCSADYAAVIDEDWEVIDGKAVRIKE